MNSDIHDQLEKRMAELPEDVRQAILSNDLGERINAIAAKHSLHIDQTGALGDETTLVMLGFTDMNQFVESITEQVKVPSEEARVIAAEVTNQIFLPIRESMKQFMDAHQETEASRAPQASLPVASATLSIEPAPPAAPVAQAAVQKELPNPLAHAELPMAEKLLTQKTVVVPTSGIPAGKPANYKADPYREPVE